MEIVPEFRKKEFLELIKDGLQDVSISRPKKNLSWGVPVPGDSEQIMYVWVDALANYITVLGYPDQAGWQVGGQNTRQNSDPPGDQNSCQSTGQGASQNGG